MILTIPNVSKNLCETEIYDILDFTFAYFGLKTDKLDISIEYEDLGDKLGLCLLEDEYGTKNPKTFSIILHHDMEKDEEIKTIIHEMIHVKQHYIGALYEPEKGNSLFWKGIKLSKDLNDLYAPWENEAYSLEEIIYLKYIRKKNNVY